MRPRLIPAQVGKFIPLPKNNSGFIIHEKARRYSWEGHGLLSIKTFSGGRALYDTGRGLHAVDHDRYLILNDRQPYSISIDAVRPVESFCVFFSPTLAPEVLRTIGEAPERLLDDPDGNPLNVAFFDRTYAFDEPVSKLLRSMKSRSNSSTFGEDVLEENLHDLMRMLMRAHCKAKVESERLDSLRPSTREELYRRVIRAADYIHAAFDHPITLDDIAAVACLSPNHLLRSFRQVFRLTPRQFLIGVRLDNAKRLLIETDLSITDICLSVGYESPASFSLLFQRRAGVSPSRYRRLKGDFR